MKFKCIGLDADDTLWHNERLFIDTKKRYTDLLKKYHPADWIESHLDETEGRNIKHFGYGVKGFTISMIETAIDLTEGRIKGDEISEIIGFGKSMLDSPLEVFHGVTDVVKNLSGKYKLLLITKGDLFDQETKLARSGLGEYFHDVEILSEKTSQSYARILAANGISPKEFVMVGNSLRSDILPVIEIGATAVHIPFESEWTHDAVSKEELVGKKYESIENISGLPEWLFSRAMM